MADGHDAVPGESFPRGYWPWRNFTTERYHANFALAAEGETLLLTQVTGSTATPLVKSAVPNPAEAAIWKFKDDGSDQNTQWRSPTFDDSSWSSGPSELGYGDTQATTVSYGPSSSAKFPTTYFRHTFNVTNPADYQGLTFRLLVDDGAVVFLNGTEIIRRNLPLGEITYRTYASAAADAAAETTFYPYNVPASLLVPGANVIAVEVHQISASSTDISFDLSVTGNTYAATTVDTISYSQQVSDVSYGRDPAVTGSWKQFAEATPGGENTTATVTDVRISGNPVTTSLAGGIYAEPQTVSLATPAGEIRYTLDGGDPTSASPLYTAPISISATTVLRARCFEAGKPPGPILTRTYLIGETQGPLPYVSLVADPETLFGDTIGIYNNLHEPLVSSGTFSPTGARDVYKGKDAPGHIEFFAPGGTPGFKANCGIRIGGENNWVHPQKALNLAVRGSYGDDEIKYNLFPAGRIPIHKALTLRDGGDRWNREMLRDCMWPKLAHGYLKVDTADYRPSVVFINGRYYGLHDVRERWDDTWFTQKYHIPDGKVDHLLYGHVTSSSVTLGVEKGDATEWLEFMNFLNTANLTDAGELGLRRIKNRSGQLHGLRDLRVLRQQHQLVPQPRVLEGKEGRIKMALVPHRHGPHVFHGLRSPASSLTCWPVRTCLKRLKVNSGFKQRLAQRYAAHMAGTFTANRVQAIMNQLDVEIPASRSRPPRGPLGTGTSSTSGMTAATARKASADPGLRHLPRRQRRTPRSPPNSASPARSTSPWASSDPAHGTLLVDGIPVPAVHLQTVSQHPVHAQGGRRPRIRLHQAGPAPPAETSITVTPAGGETITAHFAASGETVIGGTLAADTTLGPAGSPYAITDDLIVPPGITLTIPAGVTLRMTAKPQHPRARRTHRRRHRQPTGHHHRPQRRTHGAASALKTRPRPPPSPTSSSAVPPRVSTRPSIHPPSPASTPTSRSISSTSANAKDRSSAAAVPSRCATAFSTTPTPGTASTSNKASPPPGAAPSSATTSRTPTPSTTTA